jgi:hypothetical protein
MANAEDGDLSCISLVPVPHLMSSQRYCRWQREQLSVCSRRPALAKT